MSSPVLTPGILQYHPARSLDSCPAYRVALQVRLVADGLRAFLGIKATGFDVYLEGSRALHYDLEGRLVKVATPNVHCRRGLSNRIVEWRKRPRQEGGGLGRRKLDAAEADNLLQDACCRLQPVQEALERGRLYLEFADPSLEEALRQVQPLLARAAAFDAQAAREDFRRFQALYDSVPVLPPDQYAALVLHATEGCAHNQCIFCGFYRGRRFRVKRPEEFRRHIQMATQYHGAALASRRSVFLGQANALTVPGGCRQEIFQAIHEAFEFPPEGAHRPDPRWWQGEPRRFGEIVTFLDAFTGIRISAEEFASLHQLHLQRVYLGVETGDEALLRWLNKPATPEAALATVRAAKGGGVHVGVIVLIGIGGERFFQAHVRHTVELLGAMGLGRGDYLYLSWLRGVPGTEYTARARAAGIGVLSPERMREQEQRIRAGLKFTSRRNQPYIAPYDIAQILY